MTDGPTLQRTRELDPTTISAREARQFVRVLLEEAGRADWADSAELAVSEAVTNVVLHAHTRFQISVSVEAEQVRIEVRDNNPVLPSQRGYGQEATTGRGMGLIAAVSASHGVTSLGAEGKVVWFCIADGSVGSTEDELLAAWDDDVDADVSPPAPTGSRVVLRAMPPTLWLAAREHHDAILRELTLYRATHPDDGDGADLAAADAARWIVSHAIDQEIAAARAAGRAARPLPEAHPGALPEVPGSLDLELSVLPDHGAQFAQLQDALDEAERLAVANLLLVRPGLPEIIAVRDWACEQVIAQLGGIDATPWIGADDDRFIDVVHDRAAPEEPTWDAVVVQDPTRSVVAADDANRIIGVSPSLAAHLGWEPQDLVGRRVVAIVPPRFREAHVSGFSRHLSTGVAHAIGVPLDLPVLHADGSESVCEFLIQHLRSPAGRSIYVADITPKDAPA